MNNNAEKQKPLRLAATRIPSKQQPANSDKLKRVVLKEELVQLCEYKAIPALVLSQMLFWSEVATKDLSELKDSSAEQELKKAKARRLKLGEWVYKSAKDMAQELMGIASRRTISDALGYLVKRGWLETRRNPDYLADNVLQYRFIFLKLRGDLHRLGYTLDSYPILSAADLGEYCQTFGEICQGSGEICQTIPETTSRSNFPETTSKTKSNDCTETAVAVVRAVSVKRNAVSGKPEIDTHPSEQSLAADEKLAHERQSTKTKAIHDHESGVPVKFKKDKQSGDLLATDVRLQKTFDLCPSSIREDPSLSRDFDDLLEKLTGELGFWNLRDYRLMCETLQKCDDIELGQIFELAGKDDDHKNIFSAMGYHKIDVQGQDARCEAAIPYPHQLPD